MIFKSIDDLIKNADCIVVGKVENAEQFMESNMGTYKYSFKVDKYLKGEENSNQIDLYEGKDEVHVGDKYLLFLDSWESELYPNPLHTSIASDISIIKIKGNSLLGDSRIIGKMDKEQLIHLISKSPLLTVKQKKSYNIKDKAKDAEDLINSSDYVVHIIPHSVVKFNQNVALVSFQVVNQFKGDKLNKRILPLPAKIKAGEEYLVFLRDDGASAKRLATRSDSIIEKHDKEKWDAMMDKLKAKKEINEDSVLDTVYN